MRRRNRSGQGNRYHHGNAKAALLEAAIDLLPDVGAAALSLRQIAERARLSRQAPYNHFVDKEELLANLAQVGFERLRAQVAAAGELPGESALNAAAATYIEFAQISPALFRLMFSRELVDISKYPLAAAAAAASYQALAAIVARYTTSSRVADLSLAAWSIVHGYSMLCLETGLETKEHRAERARQFSSLILAQAAARSA